MILLLALLMYVLGIMTGAAVVYALSYRHKTKPEPKRCKHVEGETQPAVTELWASTYGERFHIDEDCDGLQNAFKRHMSPCKVCRLVLLQKRNRW